MPASVWGREPLQHPRRSRDKACGAREGLGKLVRVVQGRKSTKMDYFRSVTQSVLGTPQPGQQPSGAETVSAKGEMSGTSPLLL